MTATRRRLDDNLYVLDGQVRCNRCDTPTGSAASWLDHALIKEGPARAGGSLILADPDLFVDAPIVYRQAFCPGCYTALLTEVVAAVDRDRRVKRLTERTTTETSTTATP